MKLDIAILLRSKATAKVWNSTSHCIVKTKKKRCRFPLAHHKCTNALALNRESRVERTFGLATHDMSPSGLGGPAGTHQPSLDLESWETIRKEVLPSLAHTLASRQRA